MKIVNMIFCAFILIGIVNCKDSISVDERIYKKEARELGILITKYLSIRMNTRATTLPNNKGGSFIYDAEKRDILLNDTKDKWLNIYKSLRIFRKKYPNSNWADDAAFCQAIEFIFVRTKLKFFEQEKTDAICEFLDDYPNFKIEEWTKTYFSNIYKTFFNGIPSEIIENSSEIEIVRSKFYHILITQFCLNGDFQKAEEKLKDLEGEKTNIFFIKTARVILDYYRNDDLTPKDGEENGRK